jgi:hypothetical protein|tara:strand:- start:1153 stop:1890 length:738 start_codon:yes stop_codon:yes gene_type:complete
MSALDKIIRQLPFEKLLKLFKSTSRGRGALSNLSPEGINSLRTRSPNERTALSTPREFLNLAYPVEKWSSPEDRFLIDQIKDNWDQGLNNIPILGIERFPMSHITDPFIRELSKDISQYEDAFEMTATESNRHLFDLNLRKMFDKRRQYQEKAYESDIAAVTGHEGRHRAKLVAEEYGEDFPFIFNLSDDLNSPVFYDDKLLPVPRILYDESLPADFDPFNLPLPRNMPDILGALPRPTDKRKFA